MQDSPKAVLNSFWNKHPEYKKEKCINKEEKDYSDSCIFAFAVYCNDLFNKCIISHYTSIQSSLNIKESNKSSEDL